MAFDFITIKLPFIDGLQGYFDTTAGFDDNLKQQVKVLLSTEPNTRIMELAYGAGLKRFLFEPNDQVLNFRIKSYLEDKFKKFLPQLPLTNINVFNDENTVYIKMFFVLSGEVQSITIAANTSANK